MPGIHLNVTENKLRKLWNSNSDLLFLNGIKILDGTPIRGIKNCKVDFKYPITAFCGKNGSGKTTLMQLAALAFHNTNKSYRKTFADFLKKTKYDAANEGTKLCWRYKGKDEKGRKNFSISIEKGIKKWMHYDRRPIKKVVVIPVSRTLPANEKSFTNADALKVTDFTKLEPQYLSYLSKIMGRSYKTAESYQDLFAKCSLSQNCSYSSYNMGIGEKILFNLLYTLQNIDDNSLIIIDEIEMGLHPEALSELAQVMQEIALEKKLQIFVTTHSKDFLDSLPREARILINKIGETTVVTNSPTTIYAISQISHTPMKELTIICEDMIAKSIIEKSLGDDRNRVSCIFIGCKSELLKAAKYIILSDKRMKVLVIWDGDVTNTEIEQYYRDADIPKENISYLNLPKGDCPEKWVLNAIDCEAGYDLLAKNLLVSEALIKSSLEKAKTVSDYHNIFYLIAQNVGETENSIIHELCKTACLLKEDELSYIKGAVSEILTN